MSQIETLHPQIFDQPDVRRVLNKDGEFLGEGTQLSGDTLVALFEAMLTGRVFNEEAQRFQRIGRIPGYYSCAGQEAQAAIAFALEPQDWIFSAYREQALRLARGVTVQEELAYFAGKPHGGWNPRERRITPVNATIGTHLPHATGYGYASRMLGRDEVALAVFGDGATSEVDFHAALNCAGVWKTPTVFFCQNNLYAQSTPFAQQTAAETLTQRAAAYGMVGVRVDGMDVLAVHDVVQDAVARARQDGMATLIEAICYRYESHSSYDGAPVYRTREEEEIWREYDPLLRVERLLKARDLYDEDRATELGETLKAAMAEALDALDALAMPSRASLYRSAQQSVPQRLEEQYVEAAQLAGELVEAIATPPVSVVAPPADGERAAMTMVQALNAALNDAMAARPETVILGEDVGREGGIFRVTEGLYERHGAERVLDTPLCELGIIGSAVGMAIGGARPVCEIEFAGFGFTAFDQTLFHVARYFWRSNGAFTMPLVIRMPAGGNHGGLEGHSDSPEAFYAHIPGLTVVYPSNAYDAKGLLAAALESDEPVVFFEPIAQYFKKAKAIPVDHYTIEIGRAAVVKEGADVTVVTYGNPVHSCLAVAQAMEGEGVSLEVIDLRTLKPWDEEQVLASVRKTGRLVVVHEAVRSGGLGAEIVATVAEKAADWLETPPKRVTHADRVWDVALLEPFSVITEAAIATAVREVLQP